MLSVSIDELLDKSLARSDTMEISTCHQAVLMDLKQLNPGCRCQGAARRCSVLFCKYCRKCVLEISLALPFCRYHLRFVAVQKPVTCIGARMSGDPDFRNCGLDLALHEGPYHTSQVAHRSVGLLKCMQKCVAPYKSTYSSGSALSCFPALRDKCSLQPALFSQGPVVCSETS